MQKHRKVVAYVGAESPLKRLCYAKKKAGKNKNKNGYCPISRQMLRDQEPYLADRGLEKI